MKGGSSAAIKAAYDAMNNAWTAILDAQAAMKAEGVPKPIRDMLDAPRLAVSDTSAWPPLVEVLDWLENR